MTVTLPSDAEIAAAHPPLPIERIAERLELEASDWQPRSRHVAKLEPSALERRRAGTGRLILVSAITPTQAGEGKTTTSIGLAQGLAKLGQSVCLALREPSLGPCLGRKGGATGGGRAQLTPADQINLHFTGDFHAITSAHNLLAALLDNHLYFQNRLGIDPRRIFWRRVMDMNDRALRQCVVGLGGALQGVPRETGFDITAASEVMAMLCLAEDTEDLRRRIDRTLVGLTYDRQPVTAGSLRASGAMLALLHEALKPNLVQTLEGVPALVHGGPFANIAHGCNSVLATRMALARADIAITEAGFGFDLGAEKFFDIKCRSAGLDTAAVVLVATVRALKSHGGVGRDDFERPDPEAVARGLPNLDKHVESIGLFTERPIVALNRFAGDSDEEIAVVREHAAALGVPFAVSDHFAHGGDGAVELARTVLAYAERRSEPFVPLYSLDQPLPDKILAVARSMYGADSVHLTKAAERDLDEVRRLGYEALPVCVAKTPDSLSDDPRLKGRPEGFELTVRALQINAGAGFIVVLTGDILRMPGLPRRPLAESLDVRGDRVVGLS
ncbi:MAG: formate--tetrahydrofolate ligase [Acidobacteria bacterium]|nr:MAG: formate--tetrahydrofolate ligase [Acidobacteriota bacterium]REK03735.1 MAG: formate--tetrahydrofolate ligase [Acidobacteriota bacterium]